MYTISNQNLGCQELIHFFHLDHNVYESYIKSPGLPPTPFALAREIVLDNFLLVKNWEPGQKLPDGALWIRSDNVPDGSLRVFALPSFFDLVPFAKDQSKVATIVHNPDTATSPNVLGNASLVVITHPWPPLLPDETDLGAQADQSQEFSDLPFQKVTSLRIVKCNRAPQDVLKYFSQLPTKLTWQPVLKAMYKHSRFISRKRLTHFTGHYDKMGRFYLKGNNFLASAVGMGRPHISPILSWMNSHSLIKLRHRGYPGEGNSIWELPFNLPHVFAWIRDPKLKKTYLP
jgi:hypothetical protein